MEILSLKLTLTEEDLNDLVGEHVDEDEQIRDIKVRVVPQGVRVSGAYPVTFFNVRFETLWSLSIRDRQVEAHLAELRVAGAPAGLVRGMMLEMLSSHIAREEGLRVEGESIFADVDVLLRKLGVKARTNLTAIHCEAGKLTLEGGERGPVSAP
jgi:hypothetical protein